jgi:DnaK suppressor protein
MNDPRSACVVRTHAVRSDGLNEDLAMETDLYHELELKLLDTQLEWERRLEAIRSDRRRQSAPLENDFEDQATQRENDAPLDALDERGRRALEAIAAALARLAEGTFGDCLQCRAPIDPRRIRAQPTAETCIECADAEDQR